MDENKFGQVLFSTPPTYPKSLDILKIKLAPKRIFSQFCNDSINNRVEYY